MITNINTLPKNARVWIYQANEPFDDGAVPEIRLRIEHFVRSWSSHNRDLMAAGTLLHNRFVVLAVDEASAGASGCSIDKSVAFIQQLAAHYQRDLFDRWRFSYIDENDVVQTVSKDEFKSQYDQNEIKDSTMIFDPLVNTVGGLEDSFKKPLEESWLKRFV